jgi:hypothetical protein
VIRHVGRLSIITLTLQELDAAPSSIVMRKSTASGPVRPTASIWEAHPDGLTELDEDGNEVPVMRIRLDEWGNDSNPRNFRNAIFRGGSRPIDFYRRIKYGISGTIMPAADASLTDDDIWALAYYVLSIAEQYDVARTAERKMDLLLTEHAGDEHETDEAAH